MRCATPTPCAHSCRPEPARPPCAVLATTPRQRNAPSPRSLSGSSGRRGHLAAITHASAVSGAKTCHAGVSPLGLTVRAMATNRPMSRDFVARPRVIVSVIATVDGRVTLSRAERLLDEVPNRSWRTLWPADADEMLARRSAWIEQRYQPSVVLQGSGTFVNDDTGPLELPDTETDEDLWNDFLPHKSRRWFAVVDGRGRVGWRFKGDGETSLLVITSRSAPLPYLAYLRRESIPYLVAGDERVNLRAVLVKIRELLGAESVVSDAGGGLNGALIASGLVDKLHVIMSPDSLVAPAPPPSWTATTATRLARDPTPLGTCRGWRPRHHMGHLRAHRADQSRRIGLRRLFGALSSA